MTLTSCEDSLDLGIRPLEAFATAGDGVEIAPSELPAAVLEFLANNYSEDQIIKAEVYANGYEVRLDNGMKIEFDLEGNFLEISGRNGAEDDENHIPLVQLPMAIGDYLRSNYNGIDVVKAESDLGKIEVTLSDGTKLEFDAEGNFIEVSGNDNDRGNDNGPNHDANDPNYDANDDNGNHANDPNHDLNDDNGNHASDPNHDLNDDNGGGSDDGPNQDANDDKGDHEGKDDKKSGKDDDKSGKGSGDDDDRKDDKSGKGNGKDD
ncbi:hypothetical protein TK44_06210 [Jiulongibacter sediminis]|nr:hypothetical protein TK44_06210 [Jiulongibacter sediminis]